eukprot:3033897-Amphidinium_carterae.2
MSPLPQCNSLVMSCGWRSPHFPHLVHAPITISANTSHPVACPEEIDLSPDEEPGELRPDEQVVVPPEPLNPGAWFQGEWTLPEPYQQEVDRFTHNSHVDANLMVLAYLSQNGAITPLTPTELDDLKEHSRSGPEIVPFAETLEDEGHLYGHAKNIEHFQGSILSLLNTLEDERHFYEHAQIIEHFQQENKILAQWQTPGPCHREWHQEDVHLSHRLQGAAGG